MAAVLFAGAAAAGLVAVEFFTSSFIGHPTISLPACLPAWMRAVVALWLGGRCVAVNAW